MAAQPPNRIHWTPEADDQLRRAWPDLTAAATGVMLGRHENAVRRRAKRLGLPMRGSFSKFWTPEREEGLGRLVAGKLSAGQIADKLGYPCTRNMIIGKCRRIGLPLANARGFSPTIREAAAEARRREGARSKIRRPAPRKPVQRFFGVRRPPALPPTNEPAAVLRVPFLERRYNQCAYPLWDDRSEPDKRCCGLPTVEGISWCSAHLAVVAKRYEQ